MITVLHVATERGWRGGERQVLWLADGLARRGHRSLLAARPGEPLALRAAERGLEVVPCDPRFEADPAAALRLRHVVRHEGVRIVHAHTGHAVTLAALAAFRTPARMVLTRRVDFPLRRNPGTRWKYGRAAAVIAISRAVADVLAAGGVERGRIRIVPSGVDLERRIEPAPRERLAALGVPPGAPLVVLVAALVGHKDPVTFVRAVGVARRSVPALHALVVGEGPLRADVERAVAELGLTSAVHVVGYREDADALLAAADVAALSSKEEGLGTVLVDALALGKPVAATAAGGIPEIIEPGRSGLLVPPGDFEGLGAAFARILHDPSLAADLAAGARGRAAEFSVDRTVERTLAVYEEVLYGGERVGAGSHPPAAGTRPSAGTRRADGSTEQPQ